MRSDTSQSNNNNHTVLLFGDQTDGFHASIRQLYHDSSKDPILGAFLQDASVVLRRELASLETKLREALGGPFTDLLQLADRFRTKEDSFGLARALLVGIVRAAKLLQFAQVYPAILNGNDDAPVHLAGACGGLLVASALVIADDVQSLYQGSLEMVRVTCRLSGLMIARSRAVEDSSDSWGWSIIGMAGVDLQSHLDSFHQQHHIQAHRRAKIGVSDVDDGWHTVIGPPSILRLFFTTHASVKSLPRQKVSISSLTHALDALDEDEVDRVVGDSALLDVPVRSHYRLVSLGNTCEYEHTHATWRDVLRQVVTDIATKPLMLRQGLQTLDRLLDASRPVTLKVIAPTAHLATVSGFLEQSGRAVTTVHEPTSRLPETQDSIPPGRVAIVGVGGRYPASDSLEEFWNIISQGKIVHSEIPPDRFDIDELYDPKTSAHLSLATRYGCFIREPGLFDARFFNISPREAMQMDPAHRLFMMASYEALEMAGYSRGQPSARIATFLGQATEDWRDITHASGGGDAFSLGGLQRSFGPGRVSHHMRWSGPAYSVDSACASGLSSVTLACSALMARECDMAVAGAANVIAGPLTYHALSKAGFLSATGGCKTFRADADGYCRGEFVGAFVLKRLEDAVADNDNILAVVAASARNHSGGATSITRSDADAQEALMAEVLRKARVDAADVAYVEMHGTGTQVGDVAEMTAVASVFGRDRSHRRSTLKVGAVKANIGHAEAGAGSAALLKGVLMLQTGVVPPQAGLPCELNPGFPNLDDLGIEIPARQQQPFGPSRAGGTRSLLVNSFDASGGNTCVLLQDPPRPAVVGSRADPDPRGRHVVAISAKTATSQADNKRRLLDHLRASPGTPVADVAYTTTARRLHYPVRSAYAVSSTAELIDKLQSDVDAHAHARPGGGTSPGSASVVFVFTGQGSVYGGMGSELYETNAVFREKANLCARLAASLGFPPFLDVIADAGTNASDKSTVQTQLAVVTLEVALAAFWTACCGVTPAAVVGHSLGEYAALHVAGVLSLADALSLVGRRAELIQRRCEPQTYSMLAVSADGDAVARLLASGPKTSCRVACLNGPAATVVSGKAGDIEDLRRRVKEQNLRCTVLPLAYGFHSAQLDPVVDEYTRIAQGVPYHAPTVPVASTLLGEVVAASGTFNGAYLARQAREAVDFVGAVRSVSSAVQNPVWLELGPTAVCTELVRATLSSSPGLAASSLVAGADAWSTVSSALAMLYEARVDVDWAEFHRPYTKHVRLLALPSYAFDTKNYWRTYETPRARGPAQLGSGTSRGPSTTTLQRLVSESRGSETEVTFQSFFAEAGLLPLVSGHRLQGVAISPGAVFADMALTAAAYVLGSANRGPLSLRNCSFIRPVVLDESDRQQSIHLSAAAASGSSAVSCSLFNTSPRGARMEFAKCVVEPTDTASVTSGWSAQRPRIRERCATVTHAARQGRGHRLSPPLFYAMFAQTVAYSDTYRRVREVAISEDFAEAVAEVELQPAPPGSAFTLSPYWADSVVHLAGFLVNCSPARPAGVVAMLQSFEACHVVKPMASGTSYRVYADVGPTTNGSTGVDVWVLEGDELVMQYCGLKFHQVPIGRLTRMLGKQSGSTSASAVRPAGSVVPPAEPQHQTASASVAVDRRATVTTTTSTTPGALTPESDVDDTSVQWAHPRASTLQPSRDRTRAVVLEAIAESTGYEASSLTPKTLLSDLGVDSIMAIQIAVEVQEKLGVQVEAASFLEHPTIEAVTKAFAGLVGSEAQQASLSRPEQPPVSQSYTPPNTSVPQVPATPDGNILDAVLEALASETGTDIADLDDSAALADLGVDSIMAIQIATAVQDATGVELGAAMFHDYPTIGDLRRSISSEAQQQHPSRPVTEVVPVSQNQGFSGRRNRDSTGSWEDVGEDRSLSSTGLLQPSGVSLSRSSSTAQPGFATVEFTNGFQLAAGPPQLQTSNSIPKPSSVPKPLPTPALPEFPPTARPAGKPHVNVVLMHGRLSSGLTPLFLFPDGTGAASTYIYLKRLANNRPVYAVESPYLGCPDLFTCGAEHVAALMSAAVLRTQPRGPYLLAGYSGGAVLAYESARQLLAAGRRVSGLLLYDMAAPKLRPDAHADALPRVLVELMVRLMGGSRNVWLDAAAARASQLHMRHTVRCVSAYEGTPMPPDARPARTVVTWCKRGVAERLDDAFKRTLAGHGISCEPAPDFMEDPAVGPFNWTFPPGKPLGPNGWDRMLGPVKCMALDADHFSMIVPPDVDKFHRALEEGLEYCVG
ncbi:Non-reducing polyketide synthase ZEA1 [Colletotrichum spinosum]|uniref:Non-reducing polyketide synthase ZEA1 n=1 Tax=Colletotrichum spinosum TaxID=1347390 RepID=A0A4V3HSH5_9PEZI|nr:Non-reducing polyketide synthase ZEA1 [Colletotrichum spinosum]